MGSELTSAPRGTLHEHKDTFQYIPLQDGLKALLKNQQVFDEVSLENYRVHHVLNTNIIINFML